MDYSQLITKMSPEIYQSLVRSVELGKWPDGASMTPQQRENAMQAIIAWGESHLSEQDRVGYIEKKEKVGETADAPLETPLNWKE
ncbi:MAG: DUF1315 family protein [Halioglobus sp.]|nr:DUF1315 family protein [Halioglobus sp.]